MLAPPPLPRTVEASVRDLGSARAEVRASAIEDLVRHGRGEDAVRTRAVPLLQKLLFDPDAKVRASAAVGLADLRAKEAVAALLRAVDDDDAHARQMALVALGEVGDVRALPRLRVALTDRRPEMRYQAIIAFARVAEDPGEVARALLAAMNDADDAIVHIALRVAEERLDAGTLPDARLTTRARVLLDAPSSAIALVAAIFLSKAGDSAGHSLVLRAVRGERIKGQAPEKEDERAAVELAGQLALAEATPALERRAWGIASKFRDTCSFHAVVALARMKHPRATAEVLEDLRSSRREVVSAAVVSAGRAKLTEARALIEQLPEGRVDPELVREALSQLDDRVDRVDASAETCEGGDGKGSTP